MNPKHIKNVPNDRKAVAPYNFVELPEKVVEAQLPLPNGDRYYSDRHTGRIECTLTTESPLYTRCGATTEEFKAGKESKDSPNFFYTDKFDQPVIAGSSLRGMLRTLVEIVSFSKIEQVSDHQLVYRAVGDRTSLGDKYREHLLKNEGGNTYSFLMKAGYLMQQGVNWVIRPASEIVKGTSFARIERQKIPRRLNRWYNSHNAFQISVKVEAIRSHPHNQNRVNLRYAKAIANENDNDNAVVVKTGTAPRKHMEFVFGLPNSNSSTNIAISEAIIQEYKEQITEGQKQLLGDEAALKHMQPVFYVVKDNKLVFFGHAMMFRLPYEDSIKAFVPNQLRGIEAIDIAEAIFGWARDQKTDTNQARSGRVFITDAICIDNSQNIWEAGDSNKTITPQILGSPKPTTFQHYLVQTNTERRELKHYASQPIEDTVIRGHKLYWHQGSNPNFKHPNPDNASENQTTKVKPLNKGVSFKFDIRFENLTDLELGVLLWVLNHAKGKHRLKLGMGKPLGMGAIKIESELYLSVRTERYLQLFHEWTTEQKSIDDQEWQNFVKAFEIYILNGVSLKDYPNNKNKDELTYISELPRIQMLLAMLSWLGLSNDDQTRYMEIERDVEKSHIGQPTRLTDLTVNEYKDRPILPTPLQIIKEEHNCRINNLPNFRKNSKSQLKLKENNPDKPKWRK